MAIKRKVRMAGESLAVTIPSQIAQLHDIKEGDYLEFTPIGYGEFKIKKVQSAKMPFSLLCLSQVWQCRELYPHFPNPAQC